MDNKIKYGLQNMYVAKLTKTLTDGEYTYTYATPKHVPGAVSLSLSPQGESTTFAADNNSSYFRTNVDSGYSGDLELALIPDWFRSEILNETADSNGILVENSENTETVYFALLFQVEGDQHGVRHVLYNCSCSRPNLNGQTKENSISPQTETLTITADPREDGLVKARCDAEASAEIYNTWFTAVYSPAASSDPDPDPENPEG